MQHDVFANPNRQARSAYPLIVVLQADIAGGENRIVAPLAPRFNFPASLPRSRPVVEHDGQAYVAILTLLGSLPVRLLRHAIGSIRQHQDDLTRALDWLLWGV